MRPNKPKVDVNNWHRPPFFELDTWAVFAELYYEVSDNVPMTLGLRYTDEEKSANTRTIFLSAVDPPDYMNVALGHPLNATQGKDANGYTAFSYGNSEPTGRFNIQYDVSDDVMTYVQLSRSFKSGGFNPISPSNPLVLEDPANAYFEPEFIDTFEIGVKSRLLDGALQANLTYFYYDYADLQVAKIVNQTSLNENFDAEIQGFEGEFAFAPTQNLLLTANLAWLDAEIGSGESVDPSDPNGSTWLGDGRNPTDGVVSLGNTNVYLGPDCPSTRPTPELFGAPGCSGIPRQLSGNSIPGSPEFSANLGAIYTVPMAQGANLTLMLNYYWQDEYYSRVFNGPVDTIDSWEVWNASMRFTAGSSNWYAELWSRNLTDEDNITGQYKVDANSGLSTNQFLLDPRTYGVTLNYVF